MRVFVCVYAYILLHVLSLPLPLRIYCRHNNKCQTAVEVFAFYKQIVCVCVCKYVLLTAVRILCSRSALFYIFVCFRLLTADSHYFSLLNGCGCCFDFHNFQYSSQRFLLLARINIFTLHCNQLYFIC